MEFIIENIMPIRHPKKKRKIMKIVIQMGLLIIAVMIKLRVK